MTPFRLLGDGALQSLQERSRAILEAWRRDWCVNDVRIGSAIRVPAPSDLPLTETMSWWRAELEDRRIYVGLPEQGLMELARRLMGSAGGDAHPLLAAVAQDALANLAERFLRGPALAGRTLALAEAELPTSMVQRGSGCARISLELDGLALELWADAAATAVLAPPAASLAQPLIPLRTSLQGQRVSLRVELDLGTISAQRLQALQPGDVVTTSAPLHQDFTILLPERGRIASGRLGRQGAHRAVMLAN